MNHCSNNVCGLPRFGLAYEADYCKIIYIERANVCTFWLKTAAKNHVVVLSGTIIEKPFRRRT